MPDVRLFDHDPAIQTQALPTGGEPSSALLVVARYGSTPMAKSDEYRAKAEECRRMAGKVSTAIDQAAWLGLATDWLKLSRDPARTRFERFDAMERDRGTRQQASSAGH